MIPYLTTLPAGEPCRLCATQARGGIRRVYVKRILPSGVQVCPVCDRGTLPA